MRKSLKIKAFTIFFAWLVIFTHGIIPHNHVSDNSENCHKLLHMVSDYNGNCDEQLKFEKHPEENTVCHLTSLLFQQLNQDNIFVVTDKEGHFHPVILIGSFQANKSEIFSFRPYYGSSSLRAPPVV